MFEQTRGMPSVMKKDYSRLPAAEIQRSSFNRSHGLKTTFDAGLLIPVYADEMVPGDTFNLRMSAFCRLATPVKPVMDNMKLSSFFFFVPMRLIWDNWEKMCGAQDDPGDSISYSAPTIPMPATGPEVGSLSDYLGLPTDITNTYSVSAFWHRAYNLVWNEWFRDQNLQDSVTVDTDDGPDTYADYTSVLRRGKRHDYFTSCLPWPQKQTATVSMPLAGSADVDRVSNTTNWTVYLSGTDTKAGSDDLQSDANGNLYDGGSQFFSLNPEGGLVADLDSATGPDINELRLALMTQQLLERDARGGTRYTEIIRSHFGVHGEDHRLQRPTYLGGGVSDINIHPVPQTGETSTTPQGNLAAFGTGSAQGHGFNFSAVEHGVVIGLVCVDADLSYQYGVDRMFSRSTRYDWYWPSFAHLGEQAVLNKEIYVQGTAADDTAFGYQERWAEMRSKNSKITGQFRSSYATPLDSWHLAEKDTSLPALDSSWIQSNPPIDRVIVTASEPHFLFDAYFNLICARPLPVYSVPGLGGRL